MSTNNITKWNLDAAHASAGFAVRHMMIATVRGQFGSLAGTLELNGSNPSESKADITIDVSSIDTNQEQRDAHLRSGDFFNTEQYPTMRFVSKRAEGNLGGEFKLVGDLTIRDVTREVVLSAEATGSLKDPWGNTRMGFTATAKIDRRDFGLTWNQVLEAGGLTVGDEVKISIDAEFVQAAAESAQPGAA